MFSGVRYFSVLELGVSQIYLNEQKMANIRKWLNTNDLTKFEPLPVCDFGNGRLTLTDGHSRAFVAYTMGIHKLPVVYDTDDMVSSDIGKKLYINDTIWCERFKIYSVCDLKNRIIPDSLYRDLWIARCDKAYNLLTQTTEPQREKMQSMCHDLYLYGANEDLTVLFFENESGISFSIPNAVF